MELSGGEIAGERADLDADAGDDRLSALPDDILLLILRRLDIRAAGRTSVLSTRWRRVWALLPDLRFAFAPRSLDCVRDALVAHGGALRCLSVATLNASPESVAALLPVAARRLPGHLDFYNVVPRGNAEGGAQCGAAELPCFENATWVKLDLGFLDLSVASVGVFARLTALYLSRVRFHGPCELGDAVSSPRCPCLEKLRVSEARVLNNLTINSKSLQRVDLDDLRGLRQLTIVAPVLQHLRVARCFCYYQDQQVACITAPQLEWFVWRDPYDPSSVHLGEMKHVQWLETTSFVVYAYGPLSFAGNHSCLRFLQHFKVVESLVLTLVYRKELNDYQYVMDDMTMLPDTTILHLHVTAYGHAYGASLFHVLRMCSGIRRLVLGFDPIDMEAQTTCPPGCVCGQQEHWKTEELVLNCLQELEITDLRGSEHDVTFVEKLFSWATVLQKLNVTFDYSVTESKVEEFCWILQSFSRPEICTKFYIRIGHE